MKSEVKITGSKRKGYWIEIQDEFHFDKLRVPTTEEELLQLQVLLNKKFKNEK